MPIKRVVAGLGLCAVASALVLTALTSNPRPFTHPPSSSYQLYTLDQSRSVRLLPMADAQSAAVSHEQVVSIGQADAASHLSQVLQSDDGRTVAVVSFLAGETRFPDSAAGACITRQCREAVRIVTVRTGTRRSSFHLPSGVDARGLSPDGSTLIGASWNGAAWYAISTASGQVMSKVATPALHVCPDGQCAPLTAYDGPHHRLYVLKMAAAKSEFTKFGPPHLLAYNTISSRQVAHLVLGGVSYGSWGDQEWTPGFALSPDGRQIAVYDGSTNRLTLIDALRMRIHRVESVSRPEGLIGRAAQALGIEPAIAWAKGVSRGADLQMRYSPNGKLLYVTGDHVSPHAPAGSAPSIGIRAIDAAHGTIAGDSLKGRLILWIQPAPDGSALYAFAPFGDDTEVFPCILRLDPATLRIVGQRVVTLHSGNPQYYLLAAFGR